MTVVVGAVLLLATAVPPPPLPADGEIADLRRTGAVELFRGAELYGHIDGGAELYLEFGFEDVTVQRYAGAVTALEAELYRMSDPGAAFGVYLSRCGRETPDPALATRHTVGQLQLLLVRERYLLVVTGDPQRPPDRATLLAFARAVADRLPPPVAVPALALLPAAGLREGSLRLARGPLALEAIADLGDGDVLSLAGRVTAAGGSYDDGVIARIVVEYPDGQTAVAALVHLRAALDPAFEVIADDERRLLLRHRSGRLDEVVLADRRLAVTLGGARAP